MATFTILEPMSTGDVIDRAVRLYRRNFTPLVAIVAIPTLIGYLSSMMFWYGYTGLLTSATNTSRIGSESILMLILGSLGYPIYMFLLLATVAGVSRVVGDHLMMGEPITLRKSLSAAWKRRGNILLLGLLLVAVLIGLYLAFSMIIFGLILVASVFAGVMAAAQLPQWVLITLAVIVALAFLAAMIFLFCQIVARLVFLPQVVMIEGESAGSALGRAMRLGKGNWYRVGAILLFTYFVSLSMLSALTLPVLAGLYLAGYSTTEFFLSPGWTIVYSSFRDISSLLSLPIWIVSFTMLYFDSRVRKEAYDLELLAREVAPDFYWQPTVQTTFGYTTPTSFSQGRAYVQTSPLGLAGYGREAAPASSESVQTEALGEAASTPRVDGSVGSCSHCGAELQRGARFCMVCGTTVEPPVSLEGQVS
ncbi:MAG TPA: zinc ribbon domain-containing protein [Blastocatellia bacterium]|nr:zinc ribbon domain-containing protein [Blastocatellia bacterium]